MISLIKKEFARRYNADIKTINSILHQIGYVESKNVPDAIQIARGGGDGPGRGLYQFETSTGRGSGAFQTALNRLENFYNKIGEVVPDWVINAKSHDNAALLSVSQQQDVLLADLAMKEGSDKLILEAINSGNAKELWLKKHWAGANEGTVEYEYKGLQWDKDMKTYKPYVEEDVTLGKKKRVSTTELAFDAMDKIDKPYKTYT